MAKRQCTRNFKIVSIRRKSREIAGLGSRSYAAPGLITQWVGISTDEADRQKPSRVAFLVNRWPLLEEKTQMSRAKCAAWLWEHFHRIAPKSACKQCPYQEPERLLHLQQTDPAAFTELCDYDAALRTPEKITRWHGELFVHRSCRPLTEVDLTTECKIRQDLREAKARQMDLFGNECEGMCGV